MRKFGLGLFVAACLSMFASQKSDAAIVFNGNGNGASGFGGTVGGGSLSIDDDGTNLNFTFTRGGSNLDNALVLYFDSEAGGFNSTTTFTDVADGLRTAITGRNGTDQTIAQFATGLNADYVIAFDAGFAGLWSLSTGSHGFIAGAGLSPSGNAAASSHTFSVTRSQLGVSSGETVGFVGTYISTSGYRSNETFGASSTTPIDGGGNAAFTGTTTFTNSLSFTAVPEPSSMLALATVLGTSYLARRRMKKSA
jgi:hypothetical protein